MAGIKGKDRGKEDGKRSRSIVQAITIMMSMLGKGDHKGKHGEGDGC